MVIAEKYTNQLDRSPTDSSNNSYLYIVDPVQQDNIQPLIIENFGIEDQIQMKKYSIPMSIEISEEEDEAECEEIKEEKKDEITNSSKYFIESNFIMEDMNEENNISSNSKSAGTR